MSVFSKDLPIVSSTLYLSRFLKIIGKYFRYSFFLNSSKNATELSDLPQTNQQNISQHVPEVSIKTWYRRSKPKMTLLVKVNQSVQLDLGLVALRGSTKAFRSPPPPSPSSSSPPPYHNQHRPQAKPMFQIQISPNMILFPCFSRA